MQTYSLNDILQGRSPEQRATRSPDGRYVLVLTANEAFNSQWVQMGTLHRLVDGALMTQIGEWNWHVDAADWTGKDSISLQLRRYPGDAPGLTLRVDLAAATARAGDDSASIALPALTAWLEAWYAQHRSRP